MTNEELAKHWGVSLQEVKRISDYMNQNYYFALAQHKETHLWHGVMYKMHTSPSGNRTPHLWVSSTKGFRTEREAVDDWNKRTDTMICKANPALENVPVDAFKAIQKLEMPAVIPHRQHEPRIFPTRRVRD